MRASAAASSGLRLGMVGFLGVDGTLELKRGWKYVK